MLAIASQPSAEQPRTSRRFHWAIPYIGLPYEAAARGPESYDCWGLLWTVYKKEFGLELPEYPGITLTSLQTMCSVILHDAASNWIEVRKPFDGCAVAMSQKAAIHHVGVYIEADGGKVMHAWNQSGSVVAHTVRQLQLNYGFRVVKFYKHRLWPTS